MIASIANFKRAKLPLNLKVLRRYLFLRENNSKTIRIRVLVKEVYDELLSNFWLRSRIQTKLEKDCFDFIENLVMKYNISKKIPKDYRLNTSAAKAKIKVFMDLMYSLCDISHQMPGK